MNLPLQTTGNPGLENSLDGLDTVLEFIREGLEAAQAERPGQDNPDDGKV